MKLYEFVTPEQAQDGYYDPKADVVAAARQDDTRKARVTLKDLNRLKKMRAQRKLQSLKREDLMSVMYATPEEGGPM
jgi:predicted RNA-binding protein with PUA-like domain